jgi:hypothetical protein
MAHDSAGSDIGIGVGAFLAVVALVGAAAMAVVDPSGTFANGMHTAAVPFAVAMTAGVLAVTAIHLFWE